MTPSAKEYNQAAARNYSQNLRSTQQREKNKLHMAWLRLPNHPTKPVFQQLLEWEHKAVCGICYKNKKIMDEHYH